MQEKAVGQKLKQILNHSVVYGLTSSLQSILSFLLLPILTTYYTSEIFGVYSLILVVTAFASALFYFGASSALGRFYFDENTVEFKMSIISSALLITIFGFIFLLILALVFGKTISILLFNNLKYAFALQLGLISGGLGFISNTLTLIIRYEKKSVLFLTISIASVILNFLITYLLLSKFDYGIIAPILGSMISIAFNVITLAFYLRNQFTLKIRKDHIKSLVKFGLPLCFSGLTFYILDWADRFIIKDILDLSNVGVYSLGARLALLMNVFFITPFSMIWAPIRMEFKNNANSDLLLSKITSYFTIFGVSIIVVFTLLGQQLINSIFDNESYAGASNVITVLLLAQFIYGYQNILDYGIYIRKKTKYYGAISIIAIIFNILLNYILIPRFGYMAAAYVTVFTYVISTLLIFVVSSRYYVFKLEKVRILGPIFYSCLIYVLCAFKVHLDEIGQRLILLLISFTLLWFGWMNASEREVIKKKIKLR